MKLAITSVGILASNMPRIEKLNALYSLANKTMCPRQASYCSDGASLIAKENMDNLSMEEWELIERIHRASDNKTRPRKCILGGEHKPGRCNAQLINIEM